MGAEKSGPGSEKLGIRAKKSRPGSEKLAMGSKKLGKSKGTAGVSLRTPPMRPD